MHSANTMTNHTVFPNWSLEIVIITEKNMIRDHSGSIQVIGGVRVSSGDWSLTGMSNIECRRLFKQDFVRAAERCPIITVSVKGAACVTKFSQIR